MAAPQAAVGVAVIVSLGLGFLAERPRFERLRRAGAPALALASGAASGFSGTSGPLKGLAIRCLGLDRRHLVGAASLASLAGDATKAGIYAEASLLGESALALGAAAIPLMILATYAGRRLNLSLGERGFAVLFWAVMTGYSARLLALA